jgi:fatty-acyl-CoA synthase
VARRDGAPPSPDDLRAFIAPSFPAWWLPERVEIVDRIPKTSVGKFDKKALRAAYR